MMLPKTDSLTYIHTHTQTHIHFSELSSSVNFRMMLPLTPAPGGGAVESHSWTAKYYLIHSRDGDLMALDWQR